MGHQQGNKRTFTAGGMIRVNVIVSGPLDARVASCLAGSILYAQVVFVVNSAAAASVE